MEQKWFSGYGMLEYISPQDIVSNEWCISEPIAHDQYGQKFSIIFSHGNYRYTNL